MSYDFYWTYAVSISTLVVLLRLRFIYTITKIALSYSVLKCERLFCALSNALALFDFCHSVNVPLRCAYIGKNVSNSERPCHALNLSGPCQMKQPITRFFSTHSIIQRSSFLMLSSHDLKTYFESKFLCFKV